MTEKKLAEQVALMKKHLNCSDEEAKELVLYDEKVDKGQKTEYDLTPEQKKTIKKITSTRTRKEGVTNDKRQRTYKEKPEKSAIIDLICELLTANEYENIEKINKERLIGFSKGDKKYEITLVEKRKAKNA